MFKRMIFLMWVLLVPSTGVGAAAPVQAVPALDVSRYAGTWYEVARFPNRFQKICSSEVTANYALLPEGQGIQVTNRCRRADGSMTEAEALAKRADAAGPDSQLKVRFAPAWLGWLPWAWGDYWVIALAEDYRYALVGTPSRDYLWVLSRTPQMKAEDYAAVLAVARAQGFSVQALQKTEQVSEQAPVKNLP